MPLSRLKSSKRSHHDIKDVLEGLLRHIKTTVAPIEVILIGSYFRGTADEFSDIDLVVIVPDGIDPSASNFAIARDRPFREYPVDLIVMTESDYQKMRNVGGIAFEASHYGKSLTGKVSGA